MAAISLGIALLSLVLASYSLYLHHAPRRNAPSASAVDDGTTASHLPATFIVEFWSRVFGALSWLSVFKLLTRVVRPGYWLVDAWVLGHAVLAVGVVCVVGAVGAHPVTYVLVVYGLLRVLEIVVYQTNVLLFEEYRAAKAGKPYAVRGYRRLVLLLIHNYVEIICWFASTYLLFGELYQFQLPGSDGSVFGGIYSSFIVMTTFGDPNISPQGTVAAFILCWQSLIGLFMTLLSLARFIGMLPSPQSMDLFEHVPAGAAPTGELHMPRTNYPPPAASIDSAPGSGNAG